MTAEAPDARTRLIALIAEMRESAADYRVYAGVPCQSESSWHAETFESWANRLQAVADALGEPHD